MPRTRTCDYCGGDIESGTGTMFVRTNGATIHYCSSKCENNHDLGREARNLEWTETGRPEEAEADDESGADEELTDETVDEEPETDEEAASDNEPVEDESPDVEGADTETAGTDEDETDAPDEEEETEAQA